MKTFATNKSISYQIYLFDLFRIFFFTGIHDIIKYLEKYESDTWTTSEYLSCLKFLFRVVLGRHTLGIPVQ